MAALEQEMAARGLQLPVGEESVTEPISTPSGAGAGVAGVPPTGAPAEGAGGVERTGVVSTAEDAGQPAVGEGEQPGAVTEETAPAAPAEPKTQEEIDADTEAMASTVRNERNRKLYECDWTQGKDIPDSISIPWATYRQELRDVPSQPGFPYNVVWPTPPEA